MKQINKLSLRINEYLYNNADIIADLDCDIGYSLDHNEIYPIDDRGNMITGFTEKLFNTPKIGKPRKKTIAKLTNRHLELELQDYDKRPYADPYENPELIKIAKRLIAIANKVTEDYWYDALEVSHDCFIYEDWKNA